MAFEVFPGAVFFAGSQENPDAFQKRILNPLSEITPFSPVITAHYNDMIAGMLEEKCLLRCNLILNTLLAEFESPLQLL